MAGAAVVHASVALNTPDESRMVRPTIDCYFNIAYPGTTYDLTDTVTFMAGIWNHVATGQINAMGYYRSWALAGPDQGGTVKVYDVTAHLDGTAAGPPVNTTTFALSTSPASGSKPLPEQLSTVFSYRSDYGSAPEYGPPVTTGEHGKSRPRASLRGRFYLGSLNSATLGSDLTYGWSALDSGFHADCLKILDWLCTPVTTAGQTTKLVTWSRKNASVEGVSYYDVNLRFDIRRHRALKSGIHTWTTV